MKSLAVEESEAEFPQKAVTFSVYGTPAPAGSKRGFVNRRSGRVIITDDSKRSRPWKAQISDAAVEAMQGRSLLEGPLIVGFEFHLTRPKGHYGTGRNAGKVKRSAPPVPTVKPDLLKLARAVEDALTGIVYRDDAQIVCENLDKFYGEPARVEVRVMLMDAALVGRPDAVVAVQRPGA